MPYRILFVDNDPDIVTTYTKALKRASYDVIVCTSDTEAKALISEKERTFDLAVIDLRLRKAMGDTSGFDVAKAIRSDIPVIILSETFDVERMFRTTTLSGEGARRDALPMPKTKGPDALVELVRKILPHRVFVAHGHDKVLRDDVELTLRTLGVHPTILGDTPGEGDTFAEAIEKHSNVSYAVILLTPDDLGEAKAKVATLRPRARQNVILEWGYFVGLLHRDRVTALVKQQKGEELELPSNYNGLRYIVVDDDGKWRRLLGKELQNVGIRVDVERLP